MKNKSLLMLAALTLATSAQARGHLTGDSNQYGLSVIESVPLNGAASVSTSVGPINWNGTNYGILAPTASSSNGSAQVGQMSAFTVPTVLMTSSQAPASEQNEVAELEAEAAANSSGDGYGSSSNCWQGGDHNYNAACDSDGSGDGSSSSYVPFENPFAGEVWWACNGVQLPPTISQLQAQVTTYFQQASVYAGIKQSMMNMMSAQGIPAGAFQYKQTVQYASNLSGAVYQTGTDAYGYPTYGCDPSRIVMDSAQVTFSFYLDQTGQITTSGGQAYSSNLQYLYIKYYSKAMQPNVPGPVTNYYPYAGQLAYQMLDANMQPTTSMAYIDVSGAYDATDNGDPAILAAVTCIANNSSSGCNSSVPDARSLSLAAGGGNTATVIDYAAQLDVDYSTISASGTSATNMMNWYLWEQSRTLTYPQCGYAVLENQGYYSMLVDSQTNRYLVTNGNISEVNTAKGQLQLANQAFDVTQNQNPISGVASDASSVLDPTGSGYGLIPISELQASDIQQLASLTTVGTPPTSSYYMLGNTICDVTNQQTLTPVCATGFTASLDSSGNPICTGTCKDDKGNEVACTQAGTLSATAW